MATFSGIKHLRSLRQVYRISAKVKFRDFPGCSSIFQV